MFRVGVDVGGTFTDCVCVVAGGTPITAKVPTTPGDPSDGVMNGVEALAAKLGRSLQDFLGDTERFVHGTTVGTNALVERRGAKTAILTTRGHEDTFVVGKVYQKRAGLSEREMVHMAKLDLADPPLVPRELVWGVAERVDYKGAVICPLDEDAVREAGRAMAALGIKAVAVCFLWSFLAPDHERRAAELLREVAPELFVICSHDVAPVLGEYERMVTTVFSAYLGPPIDAYLAKLEMRLRDGGYAKDLLIMQASGGLAPAADARAKPVTVLDSGPVGGILGAVYLGEISGRERLICTDVGGTTFDVGLVDGGSPIIENTPIIDQYQFRTTKVQVTSIGSGGGSVAWVDETGVLKVGPRSAGADPGPACYGRGGMEPTVTDADLVLGYLDPDTFLGGEMHLDRAAAERALDTLAEKLEMNRMEVADGIRRILDSQMADLVRRTTIERGYDPRKFTLLAYGGMGPAHAAQYASDLGVSEVVIPADATAFSALGMLAAPLLRVHEVSSPRRSPFGAADADAITETFKSLERDALSEFAANGTSSDDVELRRVVLARFKMQVHELEVEIVGGVLGTEDLDKLERDFVANYVARYGEGSAYTDAGLELVSYRLEARAGREDLKLASAESAELVPRTTRPVWFTEVGTFVDTAIYQVEQLPPGGAIEGPAVLERMGDTVVIPPNAKATGDELGNIRLHLPVALAEVGTDTELDPITYEVVRNRLWAINDEQAMTAARISGTPIIYEAFDFNSGILDAEGRGIFAGVYVTYHTTGLDLAVDAVLKSFGARGEIKPGDMFITNDPWVGAIHQSDVVVISPVHHDGEIVAWTCIVMHDPDVGGPVPGGWAIGATNVYEEAPLYPPTRLMDAGRYCQETEDLFLRNSRTPALNALNMRARVACQSVARARLAELIGQYGVGVLQQVFDRIRSEVETVVKRRLSEIPDGTWREHGYLDHDGNDNILYEAHLALTKSGSKLTFDYTGTAEQAPGMINGTVSALRGGVMAAFLPMVCYDVPWATGGLADIVEIIAEPGTINNAEHPAAVSGGSVSGEAITENLAAACIAKMLACSDRYREDLMATWYPYANVQIIAGQDQFGNELASVLLDMTGGGGGARSFKDGIDCGGYLESVSISLPNVESNERVYPILEVYRRRRADTCGHGKFRGGVGMELVLIPHDCPGLLQDIVASAGISQPEASGVFGGLPAAVQGNLVLRDADVLAQLAAGKVPLDEDSISSSSTERMAAKDQTTLDANDAHLAWFSGGGSYGDPLDRDPELVARDVRQGLCSPAAAREIYAVVLGEDGGVRGERTLEQRDEARRVRLEAARPVPDLVAEVGVR